MIYHRKLDKFADTNVRGGASWWVCIGAEVELDNNTEIWIWQLCEDVTVTQIPV